MTCTGPAHTSTCTTHSISRRVRTYYWSIRTDSLALSKVSIFKSIFTSKTSFWLKWASNDYIHVSHLLFQFVPINKRVSVCFLGSEMTATFMAADWNCQQRRRRKSGRKRQEVRHTPASFQMRKFKPKFSSATGTSFFFFNLVPHKLVAVMEKKTQMCRKAPVQSSSLILTLSAFFSLSLSLSLFHKWVLPERV